jgi:plasmid stabilization system protein ParE
MSRFRLSGAALQDVAMILAESPARFGDAASERYERLIATAGRRARVFDRSGEREASRFRQRTRRWRMTMTPMRGRSRVELSVAESGCAGVS